MKMFRLLAWLPAWIVAILCSAWAFGAIYYDFPAVRQMAAGIFVLILLVAVIFVRGKLLKLAAVFGSICGRCLVVVNPKAEQRSSLAARCRRDSLGGNQW